jgi:hypothetical protein
MPAAASVPPTKKQKRQQGILARLAWHPRIYDISTDLSCVKSGLSIKYDYDYRKRGSVSIMKLAFNQPVSEFECGRVIHAIRKRLKRAAHRNNQPKSVLARKIKDMLYKLRFGNFFGNNQIYKNRKAITRHSSPFDIKNDKCPGRYDDEDCECSLVLLKDIKPTGKILRFLSRHQARDEKYAKRQKEIRGLISLADALYDLHRQNYHLWDVICPTLSEKVEYTCKLIKLYNETDTRDSYYEHRILPVIGFYIKVLDKQIAALTMQQRGLLLKPFNDDKKCAVQHKSVHSTLKYLFTMVHINNEAPNILAALENTRCIPAKDIICNACDAFWKNTLLCKYKNYSMCYNSPWYRNYCMCPNTESRPGTDALCQNWIYTPPAPRRACYSDDSEDYFDDDYY